MDKHHNERQEDHDQDLWEEITEAVNAVGETARMLTGSLSSHEGETEDNVEKVFYVR